MVKAKNTCFLGRKTIGVLSELAPIHLKIYMPPTSSTKQLLNITMFTEINALLNHGANEYRRCTLIIAPIIRGYVVFHPHNFLSLLVL